MEKRVKGYDVVEEINKGCFCDAYKIRRGGVDYFLKMYKDPTVMSSDYEDFKKNQKSLFPLLKALGNKVEKIVEDFEADGRYYQVKEFISGSTNLRKWLETNESYDDRLDVALQLCEILKAVHGKKIVHQDLKPEQLMTVRDSTKKSGIRIIMTDFDWSIPNGKIVRYVGTPWYANIDYPNVSYPSDIFTFGIILAELLTGCNPYLKPDECDERVYEPTQWAEWVNNRDYTKPILINTDLPKGINDIIIKCLEPNQKDRPSLDEIYAALQGKVAASARKKVKLRASTGDYMIMVPDMGYGRKHFKELFGRTTDSEGNEVYKYLDKNYAILSLSQEGEDLYIFSPANGMAKNKVLLNGTEIPTEPTPLKDGDRIAIYSTNKNCNVATFSVTIS